MIESQADEVLVCDKALRHPGIIRDPYTGQIENAWVRRNRERVGAWREDDAIDFCVTGHRHICGVGRCKGRRIARAIWYCPRSPVSGGVPIVGSGMRSPSGAAGVERHCGAEKTERQEKRECFYTSALLRTVEKVKKNVPVDLFY